MSSSDNTTGPGRRLRLTTLHEQQEFARLGRHLREAGLSEEQLQQELGYDDPEALRNALDGGRVTTQRLERLRQLAQERLPDELAEKLRTAENDTEQRMDSLFQRLRTAATKSEAEAGGRVLPQSTAETGEAGSETAEVRMAGTSGASRTARTTASAGAAARKQTRGKGRKRPFLAPKQHRRLREQVEHLWAVDKRFKNWSLLALVMGLSSGQAAKRAYEVNSSLTTLQSIDTFARLHAGFGSKATLALRAGVPVTGLQKHLTTAETAGRGSGDGAGLPAGTAGVGGGGSDGGGLNGGDGGAGRAGPAAGGAPAAAPPAVAPADAVKALEALPATPPGAEFETLVELGQAIDVELERMYHMAHFFDGVSKLEKLPRLVRANGRLTRDRLREAISYFAVEAE